MPATRTRKPVAAPKLKPKTVSPPKPNDSLRDFGLLFLRAVVGFLFVYVHGFPQLLGGAEKWERMGRAMQVLGIQAMPEFWGFLAAVVLSLGALLVIFGLFFRSACVLMALVLTIATFQQLVTGLGLPSAAHAMQAATLFTALAFIGPGSYNLDKYFQI